MTQEVRFVLIDDNPDDRSLARRTLERDFNGAEFVECGERAELDRELRLRRAEVVVTDYQLRWGDGLEVVRAFRSAQPKAVLIMFTDSGSQEVAVEAMKSGLDDYLVKGPKHLPRLPLAVRSALDRRAAARRAADLETRYRLLFDRLNIGIYRATSLGRLVNANPAMLRLLGVRSVEDTKESPVLAKILWGQSGTPGPQSFLHAAGDRRHRQIDLPAPNGANGRDRGELKTYDVQEVVTDADGELFIDGIVEARH